MKIVTFAVLTYFLFCLFFIHYLYKKKLLKKRSVTSGKNESAPELPESTNNKSLWFTKFLLLIGKITSKAMPGFYLDKLSGKIDFISIRYTGLSIYCVLGFKILTALASAVLLTIIIMNFSNLYIFSISGFIFGFFTPDFFVNIFVKKLNGKIENELAHTADLIYVATLAGQSIYNAIKMVVNEYKGYISSEFSIFLKDIELGFGKEESYSRLLSRNNPESFKRFIFMLQQAENYGSSISEIISQKADFSRFEISQAIDKKTRLLSTKILFPLIFLVLPSFLLIVGGPLIYVIGGDFF